MTDKQPQFKSCAGYCLDCGADHSGFTCDQFCTMRSKAMAEQAAHASTTAATPQDGTTVQGYRKLSESDMRQMNDFKARGRALVALIDTQIETIRTMPALEGSELAKLDGASLRWLSIARTHAQQAVMAACRAVAKPEDDC